jgi:hypothetical protein
MEESGYLQSVIAKTFEDIAPDTGKEVGYTFMTCL